MPSPPGKLRNPQDRIATPGAHTSITTTSLHWLGSALLPPDSKPSPSSRASDPSKRSRLIPGVLASSECYEGESHASGILEYSQYTKPREFLGRQVPEVLLSGDHKKIERWRLEDSVRITKERRPELLSAHPEYEEALMPKRPKRAKK